MEGVDEGDEAVSCLAVPVSSVFGALHLSRVSRFCGTTLINSVLLTLSDQTNLVCQQRMNKINLQAARETS